MDIYSILSLKPHNPHYLNRYITFIQQCQQKNVGYIGYIEEHHICPKADDMFPEYTNFRLHPWNCAVLTARQHFIAHIMLWKTFPYVESISFAAHSMRNYQSDKINSKLYENLKISFIETQRVRTRRYHSSMTVTEKKKRSEKLSASSMGLVQAKNKEGITERIQKIEFDNNSDYNGHTKGMTSVKDKNGKFYFVSVDDPRIKSGELVGPNKGRTFSEEVKKKLSKIRKGKKLTEETKNRMRKRKGPQKRLVCPHCGKEGGLSNIRRYHFDNCSRSHTSSITLIDI